MTDTEFRPRTVVHIVRVAVFKSQAQPLPYAEHGTTWIITRAEVEWRRMGTDPWRLYVVTAYGAASNGTSVTRDFWPDNASKQIPKELSAWVASTHPEVPKGQST